MEAQLYRLTRQLKDLNQAAYRQFTERTQQENDQADFYREIKPFADHMQILIDKWRPLAEKWAAFERPAHLFPVQIKDTYDNLAIVCVTAFQKDTRKRRFYETIKSIDYVLDTMLQATSERHV
nr:YppE family protein [Sporolactobacillus mangiferae]